MITYRVYENKSHNFWNLIEIQNMVRKKMVIVKGMFDNLT